VPTRQWAGTIAWSIALLLALAWKAGSATLVGVALVVPSLFALAMYQPLLRRVLSRPGITAVGIASYSLYLLHNHIGAAVLHALPASFWEQPWRAAAVAFAMMPVLCALSVVSYRYIETPLNRWTLSQLMTRLVSRPPPAAPVVTRG
jgi:peptidoglycan/LPS O-acetylase OafA/YrhL